MAALPDSRSWVYLDRRHFNIVMVSPDGTEQARYGGWGTGPYALHWPVDLVVGENSIFVLDQGVPAIIRLDLQLQPVAVTPLPADTRPLAMGRDRYNRYWVIDEDLPGVWLYDDHGRQLDSFADGRTTLMVYPRMVTLYESDALLWDPAQDKLVHLGLSGQLKRILPLTVAGIDDMALRDRFLFLSADGQVFRMNLDTGDQIVLKPLPDIRRDNVRSVYEDQLYLTRRDKSGRATGRVIAITP